jgi:hypothetical protein
MIVVNLFGGPGCGKSTTAAGLFYKMKLKNHRVELVQEYAKDLTWEKRYGALENQAYVFAKQLQRLYRLDGQVDIAITDSPLLLSLMYTPADYPFSFRPFVIDMISRYNNVNYMLTRVKPYQQYGRNQTEEEAKIIDYKTIDCLDAVNMRFRIIKGDETAVDLIYDDLVKRLEKENAKKTEEKE